MKNSVLIPHRMVSIQSSRENSISGVELWRNGPFNAELPSFSPQMTSVYPFPWELSPQVASGHSFPLELSSRSHILDPQQHFITQNTMFFTNKRLLSKEAEHFEFGAPYLLFTQRFPVQSSYTFVQISVKLQKRSQIKVRAPGKLCKM